MKYQSSLSLFLSLVLGVGVAAVGQTVPTPAPPQGQTRAAEDEDEVVRITTNLVQLDAVVTDGAGRHVSDLGPEDFEVLEDERPQAITNFSFIETGPAASSTAPAAAAATSAKGGSVPPLPPARLRREEVRRTLALVVDDLRMSFLSLQDTRDALKRFVDEQLQPGDLVAVIRTSSGVGSLEQFTSDKRQLYAAIERLRWYPSHTNTVETVEPITNDTRAFSFSNKAGTPESSRTEAAKDVQRRLAAEEELRQSRERSAQRDVVFTSGTLGAVNFILRGLRGMPGRKSLVLFADGIGFNQRSASDNTRVFDLLRRLADFANRSSVVFYTIDSRGLFDPSALTAFDDVGAKSLDTGVASQRGNRRDDFIRSQDGMAFLPEQTGGFFLRGTGLKNALKLVADDQKGFYLIGYRPSDATFKTTGGREQFRNIKVRVKRPGLRVRSRLGFYGTAEEAKPSGPRTREDSLLAALTSPFASGEIPLRLTTLFLNEKKAGSVVRSMLHLDARPVTFETEAGGGRKAVMDVAAVVFGEAGQVVERINRTHTIRVSESAYQGIQRQGLRYDFDVPVRRPGAYQLRVALRDAASDRTGAAGQFIEVPNLDKGRLALSGLLVNPREATGAAAATTASEGVDSSGSSARRFRHGSTFDYGYLIYNARLDKATGRPRLTTQARLFRDGQLIHQSAPQAFDAGRQTDMERLLAAGSLQVGADLPPGEYVLQVVVQDSLAGTKSGIATQWIDFQVVK
ncbi:MAG TPA: VWA domain-containing protein [Pyrinomonadaceae bacterium]|nr:VWA domain-containing protein [Pyrinomonadaceae bacterium]